MCGLVGAVGFLEHKHKQAMKDLIYLNTLRGKDSTGISCVRRDKTVATRKMTVPGYEFLEYPAVEKAMQHADQAWLGHGRFKTMGAATKANAHPFEVIDEEGYILLVGTHNGTLDNKWDLERMIKGKPRFETDSEALFNWFVEAPNYKEAINELKGAWSLAWWDPTTDSFYMCRNDKRPMTFAFTEDRRVMFYASEPWMILAACGRNDIKLKQQDNGLSCYATLPDHLYTMEIPQERDRPLPELKREGGYTGKPVINFQDGLRRFNHWWNEDDPNFPVEERQSQTTKVPEAGKTNKKKDDKKVITLGTPSFRGYGNEQITKERFEAIAKKGCGWCGEKELLGPGNIFAFLNEDTLVCVRCMRDTHPNSTYDDGDDEFIDDDLPFDLTDKGREKLSEDSEEYKRMIQKAADKAVG